MGKATILSHLGNGQYSVRIHYDTTWIDTKTTMLEWERDAILEKKAELQEDYDKADTDLKAAEAKVSTAISEFNTWLGQFNGDPDGAIDLKASAEYTAMIEATKKAIEASKTYNEAKLLYTDAENRLKSIDETLAKDKSDGQQDALSQNNGPILTGEVAVMPLSLEPTYHTNILPGYTGNLTQVPNHPPYSVGTHGNRVLNKQQPWHEYLAAWTMFEAMQKWRPVYLEATLTALDEDTDTGTVDLLAVGDQENGGVFTGVSVTYMSCNSAAFRIGDKVVVKIANNTIGANLYTAGNMTIVGFKENPRDCGRLKIEFTSQLTGDPVRWTGSAYAWRTGSTVMEHNVFSCVDCGHYSWRDEGSAIFMPEWDFSNEGVNIHVAQPPVTYIDIDIGTGEPLTITYSRVNLVDHRDEGVTFTDPCNNGSPYTAMHRWDITEREFNVTISGIELQCMLGASKYGTDETNVHWNGSDWDYYQIRYYDHYVARWFEWVCSSGAAYSYIEETMTQDANVYDSVGGTAFQKHIVVKRYEKKVDGAETITNLSDFYLNFTGSTVNTSFLSHWWYDQWNQFDCSNLCGADACTVEQSTTYTTNTWTDLSCPRNTYSATNGACPTA